MQVAVEGGTLVRVFAVAQVHHLDEAAVGLGGEGAAHGHLRRSIGDGRQVVADRRVVLGHAVEGGHRQREAGLCRQCAGVGGQFLHQAGVLVRRGGHRHPGEILGRAAQHRRAADVDVLHRLGQAAVGAGGHRLERIQVQHQQVDRVDAVLGHHRLVDAGAAEQAAVHPRMQGLDPAIHHFGELGEFGHVLHRQPGLAQGLGGAAGGKQFDAVRGQRVGQVKQAGLVGNRQQRPAHGQEIGSHRQGRGGGRGGIIAARRRPLRPASPRQALPRLRPGRSP